MRMLLGKPFAQRLQEAEPQAAMGCGAAHPAQHTLTWQGPQALVLLCVRRLLTKRKPAARERASTQARLALRARRPARPMRSASLNRRGTSQLRMHAASQPLQDRLCKFTASKGGHFPGRLSNCLACTAQQWNAHSRRTCPSLRLFCLCHCMPASNAHGCSAGILFCSLHWLDAGSHASRAALCASACWTFQGTRWHRFLSGYIAGLG